MTDQTDRVRRVVFSAEDHAVAFVAISFQKRVHALIGFLNNLTQRSRRHQRMLHPMVAVEQLRELRPVLRHQVPRNAVLRLRLAERILHPAAELRQPRQHLGGAVQLFQRRLHRRPRASQRRNIKIPNFQLLKPVRKQLRFPPALLRERVDGVIGVSVANQKDFHGRFSLSIVVFHCPRRYPSASGRRPPRRSARTASPCAQSARRSSRRFRPAFSARAACW